jgi:Flp pilus assembly CpaE family ATPase
MQNSGVRVLAAPRELLPLDALHADAIEGLVAGLKRDFDFTLIDLPPVWTPWTSHLLHLVDNVQIVTRLSVPHMHQVRRQLSALGQQGLDTKSVTIVCNAVKAEESSSLSLRAAQAAIGRQFDIVIPDLGRLFVDTDNEGVTGIEAALRNPKLANLVDELLRSLTSKSLSTVGQGT